jgi:DNA polymerase-3 subunit alpha (Gram-positive type)
MADRERLSVSVERFRELVNGQELEEHTRQFLDGLRGLDVVIDPEHRSWELLVDWNQEESPSDELRDRLEQRFRQQISSLDEVLLTSRPLEDQSLEDWIRCNWSSLKNYLGRLMPAGGSMLEYSRPCLSESTLVVEVADEELKGICRKQNMDETIREWVSERFGDCPPVEFAEGDFSNEIEKDAETFHEETRQELEEERRRRQHRAEKRDETILLGSLIDAEPTPMEELSNSEKQSIVLEGKIIDNEFKQTRDNKKNLVTGVLTDKTDSIGYKVFVDGKNESLTDLDGEWVKMRGRLQRDNYTRNQDLVLFADDINRRPPMIRDDTADEKRVELHLHSRMSQLDALEDVEELIERAAYWNHPAIAVTDHGVVHSFPEAAHAAEEYGVKLIYGVEGYLVQDERPLVLNVSYVHAEHDLSEDYVVLDCATTGPEPHDDAIFHLHARRIRQGDVAEEFDRILEHESVSEEILEKTELTADQIENGSDPDQALEEFQQFLGDSALVTFEADAVRHFLEASGVSIEGPIVHLRRLSEEVWEPPSSDLDRIVENRLGVSLDHQLDPRVTVDHQLEIFRSVTSDLPEPLTLEDLQQLEDESDHEAPSNHIILLAVNRQGLKNLYRLISHSHVRHFYRHPKMLRSKIDENRVGLMVGSACEAGEIFQAVVHGETDEEIKDRMEFYDYVEIQPIQNNDFMLDEGGAYQSINTKEDLEEINRRIYRLAKELDKPVVGTGDVHFMDQEDEVFRQVLQAAQEFDQADDQPPLYYRTTDEMLDQFEYLGDEAAREVVVDTPREIADTCERIDPIPDGFHPPNVEDAEEIFRQRISRRLKELYGEDPPELVRERVEAERESILDNEFANLYVTSAKLVDKSHEDGYLVGSRGSVGSSFTAYLMDITEVNPLPPHYRCENCNFTYFPDEPEADTGIDLPAKDCPECGEFLQRDGFEIPFEVFCGFEGEKIPDIDLNFSGEYQQVMFDYVEELFGEKNVFRAGTIDTVADKTAASFVDDYLEERNLFKRDAERTRLMNGLTGVKQNTSQHPGGMIIVPEDRSVYEFTPINMPANDRDARFQTTHFDYHAMEEQLVKLDVLGHDDPTQLRHLQEMTGVDPETVPLDDEKTMKLFSDISVLGLDSEQLDMETGVLAVPEFNTSFVRGMVEETRPQTFADLVRISGLSHGEAVWLDNAQDLIRNDVADLESVISARDDIMNRLIDSGVPEKVAFDIMEDVRKGRGLSDDQIRKMKAQNVPDWYVESCKQISYLFPKAHAAAYVVMAFRIAYFKVHYPTEFYASYFTLNTSSIDAAHVESLEVVKEHKQRIETLIDQGREEPKDRQEHTILEVLKEAYLRDVSVRPPKLHQSHPKQFTVEEQGVIRAPYVTVNGLGDKVAETIDAALKDREFSSIEDVKNRTGITKNVVEEAHEIDFFEGLPEEENHDLFG